MSSSIRYLAQKYRTEIEKLQSWNSPSDKQKVELVRLQKLAQTFMALIVQLCCSDTNLLKLNERWMKDKVDWLLILAGKQKKMKSDHLKKIIGKYINDEFKVNAIFNGLKTEFQLMYQEEQIEQGEQIEQKEVGNQTSMNLDHDDEEVETYANFLSSLNSLEESTKSTYSIQKNIQKLPKEFKIQHAKQQQTWGNDPHQMRVMSYLLHISAPQTELSYLCQSMGWKLNFGQKPAVDGKFQVIAEVNFSFKKIDKLLQESHKAHQKKLGRMVSSFKMLRKIYISFPEIWDIYDELRQTKSLIIEKNPFNPISLLQPQILKEKVEPISKIKHHEKDEIFEKQKDQYIKNISSFKSELNLLTQQNPGVFTIKMDKIQTNHSGIAWRVKGELAVKLKGKERQKEMIEQNLSSKIAEQNIARQLVNYIYDQYKQILQKMIMIKNKKCIKT